MFGKNCDLYNNKYVVLFITINTKHYPDFLMDNACTMKSNVIPHMPFLCMQDFYLRIRYKHSHEG